MEEALQRMERLVERMARADVRIELMRPLLDEARAILALKVDPDLKIAQQICDRAGVWSTAVRDAVLAGIKYGRAMGAFEEALDGQTSMADAYATARPL